MSDYHDMPKQNPETLAKTIRIEINVAEAVMLLATLQLSLRHPVFKKRSTAAWTRGFATALQKAIVTEAPDLQMLCDAGWIERFDQ